jgi:hypothetical protein
MVPSLDARFVVEEWDAPAFSRAVAERLASAARPDYAAHVAQYDRMAVTSRFAALIAQESVARPASTE